MRTRTRDVVRMLATLRHAAHCRSLRAAKAREVLEENRDDTPEDAEDIDDTCEHGVQRVSPGRSH
jgi:hypothetical protein